MAEFSELVRIKKRICDKFSRNSCNGCPLSQNGCEIISIIGYRDFEFKKLEETLLSWAAEHPEQVYPTWGEWLEQQGICFSRLTNYSRVGGISIPQVFDYQIEGKTAFICGDKVNDPIPADIAEKLGIEPKEG